MLNSNKILAVVLLIIDKLEEIIRKVTKVEVKKKNKKKNEKYITK